MKKFLTVLLVIAVMFTFSFSAAFAAVPSYDANLAKVWFDKAMEDAETAESINIGYDVTYSVLAAHKEEIFNAVVAYEKGTATDYVKVAANIVTVLQLTENADLALTLVAEQYAADKEEALAILAGLDTSSFSTEKMTVKTNDQYMTYAEAVKYYISVAEDAIKEATFTSDSVIGDYATAKNTIDAQFNAYTLNGTSVNAASTTAIAQEKGYNAGTSVEVGLGVYAVNEAFAVAATANTLAAYKIAAVNAEKATAAAGKEALKATAKSEYAQYVSKNTSTAAVANADKALEAVLYTIDNDAAITFASLVSGGNPNAVANIDATFLTNYKNIVAFEAFADRYAAEKDATGALVRDAEDIADIVNAAKLDAYKTTAWAANVDTYGTTGKTYEEAVKALSVAADAAELEYTIKHYEALADKVVADAKDAGTYYAKELAEVEALVAEYKAKAAALTDTTKITNLYNTYFVGGGSKVSAVEIKAAAVTGTPASAAATTIATGDIKDLFATAVTYRDLFNGSLKGDNKYTTDAYTLANAITKMVGDAGARTAKDIAALGSEIPALVQALPTVGAVTAAKDAADDAVKAAKYTDKASIDAAIKAADAYDELTGLTYNRAAALDGKITSMAYAELNTLNTEYTNASKKDKAALKAIQDKMDAFVDEYGNATVFGTLNTNISNALAAIKADEAKAVADKINALPINVTEADKATVEAARKAYDDFVAEYTDYENAQSAEAYLAANGVDASALASAETVLGLNQPSEEENVKALLADVTAKASSAKVSKGIKVTVKADVSALEEAGYTVEYKFYRSTKKASGYVYKKTSKTGTYTNTAGTKGVKYYYKAKLVVKNAAGEVVAESPLKQCTYACRTWK